MRAQERLLERLARGEWVEWREAGNSMLPLIASREPVTLAPVDPSKLEPGDVVFAKVRGRFYLHKVSAIDGNRVQISNNRGHVNGWTTRDRVYAIVVAINGTPVPKASAKIRNP